MEEEAADELLRREGHDPLPVWAFGSIVLPLEGDAGSIETDQAGISDGDAVRTVVHGGSKSRHIRRGQEPENLERSSESIVSWIAEAISRSIERVYYGHDR